MLQPGAQPAPNAPLRRLAGTGWALRRFALPLLTLIWAGLALAADPSFPVLTGRIVDNANLINAEARTRIEQKLQAHEAKTGDQLVVATLPSLQGYAIEDFGNRLFRHWQIGEKQRNNGALLLVAPTERKVRIEVGYGLEGALTDALSKIIITTAVAPKFKTGDFAGGIEGGVDAILTILAGDAEEWQRRATVRSDESSFAETLAVILVMVFIVIMVVSILRELSQPGGERRHRMRNGRWVTLPPTSSSWGSGSGSGWSGGWGGGNGGSSSGGGFSGGGGSSGGGGASGDW